MRKVYYQLLFTLVGTLLATIFLGCEVDSPTAPSGHRAIKKDEQIVGCEYYFDKHGVRSYYWMSGSPHLDLWIKMCYNERGLNVPIKGRDQ